MAKTENIYNIFTSMDDSEIISIWNEYCYECNCYDDEIIDYDSMCELIENSNEDGLYWVNRFFYGSDDYGDGSANPNRNYFTFNGYGNIESFDYIYNKYSNEFNHIDIDALIDYIVENDEDFNNDDIREILDDDTDDENDDTETA